MTFLRVLEYTWPFAVNSNLVEEYIEVVANEVKKIKRNVSLRLLVLFMS